MTIRIRVHPQGAFGAYGVGNFNAAELARQQLDFERQKSMMQLDFERQLFQQQLANVQMSAVYSYGAGAGYGNLGGYANAAYPSAYSGGYSNAYSSGCSMGSGAPFALPLPVATYPTPMFRHRGRRRRPGIHMRVNFGRRYGW